MRRKILFALLGVALMLTTGCCKSYLCCRSEYLYPTYLASEQIDTPDPMRACFYGQQIIVQWRFPEVALQKPVTLLLHIRYGDREVETVSIPIEHAKGWWIHRLVNRDYWCHEGILAFQVQLVQEGELIDQWSHCLWAEIITLPEGL